MFGHPVPEPVFLTTTPVAIRRDNDAASTGFFFNYEDQSYLITTVHSVVPQYFESDNKLNYRSVVETPPTLVYWVRDEDDLTRAQRHELDLSDDSVRWAFYPGDADVAVFEIPQDLPSIEERYEDPSLNSSFAIPEEYTIGQKGLTEDSAFVLGYPGDIYDRDTRLPIRRGALIASVFNVPFQGKDMFLTDARMDEGMSGSPVLVKSKNVVLPNGEHPRNPKGIPYLIGIHTGNYPLNQDASSESERLRYSDINETWYSFCAIGAIRWLNQMEPPEAKD